MICFWKSSRIGSILKNPAAASPWAGESRPCKPGFNRELLKRLTETGIHTALDTCGMCSRETLERLLPYSDLLLFDLKETDPQKHRRFTGSGNEKILQNLIRVARWMKSNDRPKKLWIRTPIIPDATATSENIREIGKFICDPPGWSGGTMGTVRLQQSLQRQVSSSGS